MSTPNDEPRFNAFTDPWLPLLQQDGTTSWSSPVEVLCGEKDGIDLDYPRDDFRIYARLLLSALVQALAPPKDSVELLERFAKPLVRTELEGLLAPVIRDFDLFGPTPFLQTKSTTGGADEGGGAARFVFADADLYKPSVEIRAISIPIALVAIFVEQTYAGGAGRGYGAGPGGQPGVFTLVDPGSVRQGAWANTLSLASAAQVYPKDDQRPWSNEKKAARMRSAIGVVGGLFFQPRSVSLIPIGQGTCSFSGTSGFLVRMSPLGPKSELAKKPSKGEDLWIHPCAPMAVNSAGIAPVRLNAQQPAWTGLAQVLFPVSKGKKKQDHPLEGPARVLKQWRELGKRGTNSRLLLLDFERDKANIKKRFFEAYSLTHEFLSNKDLVERLRTLVAQTEEIAKALRRFLASAHDERKAGGFAIRDAETLFWSSTEGAFLKWLAEAAALAPGADDTPLLNAHESMLRGLRQAALKIFDAHVEISEFDPRKQKRIALARKNLQKAIWPTPAVTTNHATKERAQ